MFFRYHDDRPELGRHRSDVTSPQAIDSGVHATSPDYYIDLDCKTDWDLPELNSVGEPSEHTVLKTKFTELQEACCPAGAFVFSSIVDVADFALG